MIKELIEGDDKILEHGLDTSKLNLKKRRVMKKCL